MAMRQLTLEDIAPRLPYGQLMMTPSGSIKRLFVSNNMKGSGIEDRTIDICLSDGYRPILNPMSNLIKPILVEGYNDDKEFTPIEELFRLAYKSIFNHRFDDLFIRTDKFNNHLALQAKEIVNGKKWIYGFTVELPNHFLLTLNGDRLTIPNFDLYKMLYRWHFDTERLIEDGLAVDKNTIK